MPTQFFSNGNDSYIVNAAGDFYLAFLDGNDSLTVKGGTSTIAVMGEGDDYVRLETGPATAYGDAGADRFDIWASGATAYGGTGDDRFNFYASATGVQIFGGDGSDDFFGYNHAVTGSISGGAGNDYFVEFRGGVTLIGGTGNDIYRAHATDPATFVENPGEGTDSVQVARGASFTLGDNFENISVQGFSGSTTGAAILTGNALNNSITGHANVETINGLGGNDRLFAKGGNDTVWGGDGNDYIDGGDGADSLYGEAGNDTINGRAGLDSMTGGTGDDLYYVDSSLDLIFENVGEGVDTVRSTAAEYALDANVENGILSGTGDLFLYGNQLANELIGNSGANLIAGLEGNDIIRGGGGSDTLFGDDGEDTIYGGAGGDLLIGSAGADTLVGGTEGDNFKWYLASDSSVGSGDVVTDFDMSVDLLDFSEMSGRPEEGFGFSGEDPAAYSIWLVQTADNGDGTYSYNVYADSTGDGVADVEVTVHTDGLLSASEILF